MCDKCNDLIIDYRIDSPFQLKEAISIVKENILDGTISEITANHDCIPFLEFASGDLWGDVVSYHFKCHYCRKQFELTVEAYHGAGGWWRPIETIQM